MKISKIDILYWAVGKWLAEMQRANSVVDAVFYPHHFNHRRIETFPVSRDLCTKSNGDWVGVVKVEIRNTERPMEALQDVAALQRILNEKEIPSEVVISDPDEDPDGEHFAELRVFLEKDFDD